MQADEIINFEGRRRKREETERQTDREKERKRMRERVYLCKTNQRMTFV